MAATKMFFITWFSSSIHLRFFRSGFGYAGFSDLEDVWDDLPVSRLKYNALTDLSVFVRSDGVFSHVYPFHNRSERFGFSDLEDVWDDLPVSRLKYNALTDLSVFVRSDGVFSHVYPFHNRSERFGF
ncbi:hypothetical protein F2Q69_00048398 [Brassica cretica]|uniref:Uncharacterized protein n=1 Tax=Brassica cretica TaxID=69181 RepID=A0A8S9PUB5_BRACR|nr:hypothetical protein F2Q69_00048398 [Brassica cretica]